MWVELARAAAHVKRYERFAQQMIVGVQQSAPILRYRVLFGLASSGASRLMSQDPQRRLSQAQWQPIGTMIARHGLTLPDDLRHGIACRAAPREPEIPLSLLGQVRRPNGFPLPPLFAIYIHSDQLPARNDMVTRLQHFFRGNGEFDTLSSSNKLALLRELFTESPSEVHRLVVEHAMDRINDLSQQEFDELADGLMDLMDARRSPDTGDACLDVLQARDVPSTALVHKFIGCLQTVYGGDAFGRSDEAVQRLTELSYDIERDGGQELIWAELASATAFVGTYDKRAEGLILDVQQSLPIVRYSILSSLVRSGQYRLNSEDPRLQISPAQWHSVASMIQRHALDLPESLQYGIVARQ